MKKETTAKKSPASKKMVVGKAVKKRTLKDETLFEEGSDFLVVAQFIEKAGETDTVTIEIEEEIPRERAMHCLYWLAQSGYVSKGKEVGKPKTYRALKKLSKRLQKLA